jgi:hypothetical protein
MVEFYSTGPSRQHKFSCFVLEDTNLNMTTFRSDSQINSSATAAAAAKMRNRNVIRFNSRVARWFMYLYTKNTKIGWYILAGLGMENVGIF